MAWDKVASGQKIRQTPIHRAGFINDTIDVVNAYKDGRLARPPGGDDRDEIGNRVFVRNLTGADRALGQVVQLGSLLLTDVTKEHPWFEANLFTGTVARRCAVLTRPLKAGAIGPAQVAGICPASVLVLNTAHTHAFPSNGSSILRSTPAGPMEFVSPPTATGVRLMWVKLDYKENRCYHVTLTATFAPGASGFVVLSDGRFVTATNWSTDTTLVAGEKCLCFEDLVDNFFYLVKTGDTPKLWHSTAVDDIDAGASGTVELPDTTEVEATNWSDDLDIKAADKIHVYQDPTDDEYYAIKSGGHPEVYRATMSGTLTATTSPGSVTGVVHPRTGDTLADGTAWNYLGLSANNGDTCYVVESTVSPSVPYEIIAVKKRSENQKFALGLLIADLYAADASASIDSTSSELLDGTLDAIASALNTFNHRGFSGDYVLLADDSAGSFGGWIVVAVISRFRRRVKAQLNGALSCSDASATVDTVSIFDQGPTPTITTASNPLKLSGPDNAVVILEEISSASPSTWFVAAVEEQCAVLFKGLLNGNLTAGTSTIAVDTLSSYTASAAPSGSVTANNVFKLDGRDNDVCAVIKNRSSGTITYELLRVEQRKARFITGTLAGSLTSGNVSHYWDGPNPGSSVTLADPQSTFTYVSNVKFMACYDPAGDVYNLIWIEC